jgi:predicted regulator of Ras-like GTPase activity (Roadblock/LC7/MglB family)
MFQALLRDVVEGTEGGVASLLMDFEGIAVDSYSREGAELDIAAIGAEFSVVMKSVRNAAQMLDAGEAAEVSVQAQKMITIFRVLNESYFMALTLLPEGNVGKGRYLLRTRAPAMLEELQ